MENRFGVKDFFLFLLLIALIVSVWLAMKQSDRQWDELQVIKAGLGRQGQDLRDIQDALARGVAVANPGMQPATASTQAAISPDDPSVHVREAQRMPGYAPGDWLINAAAGQLGKLTPLLSSDQISYDVQLEVQESLVARDPYTEEWKPILAKSWQVSDDGLRFTFQLREGLRFSDGEPLTADDVVFTHQFIMDPQINAPRDRVYYGRVKRVEKLGPLEVAFIFEEPYFQAMDVSGGMPIMPKHFYGKFTPQQFNESVGLLMGSGPYRMEDPASWKPGTLTQLVRNERYWGAPAAFSRIVYKEISNDVARLTSFRNGDIDHFEADSAEQYRDMVNDRELVARTQHFQYSTPNWGFSYAAWNQERDGKPTLFSDKRVRQALTLLIDRKRIIQELRLGLASEISGPFYPRSPQCSPKVQSLPHDVERAKQLLAEAGFKDNGKGLLIAPNGEPFRFKLSYRSGSPSSDKLVLFLKDSFARAGIVLEPDVLEWSTLIDRLDKKQFEAVTLAWTGNVETDIYQWFHSHEIQPGADNFISYRNAELDREIETARRTVKEDLRMPHWQRCHEIIHEDQPYTFLFAPMRLRFLDNRIKNVRQVKLDLNPQEEWFVPRPVQKYH